MPAAAAASRPARHQGRLPPAACVGRRRHAGQRREPWFLAAGKWGRAGRCGCANLRLQGRLSLSAGAGSGGGAGSGRVGGSRSAGHLSLPLSRQRHYARSPQLEARHSDTRASQHSTCDQLPEAALLLEALGALKLGGRHCRDDEQAAEAASQPHCEWPRPLGGAAARRTAAPGSLVGLPVAGRIADHFLGSVWAPSWACQGPCSRREAPARSQSGGGADGGAEHGAHRAPAARHPRGEERRAGCAPPPRSLGASSGLPQRLPSPCARLDCIQGGVGCLARQPSAPRGLPPPPPPAGARPPAAHPPPPPGRSCGS